MSFLGAIRTTAKHDKSKKMALVSAYGMGSSAARSVRKDDVVPNVFSFRGKHYLVGTSWHDIGRDSDKEHTDNWHFVETVELPDGDYKVWMLEDHHYQTLRRRHY